MSDPDPGDADRGSAGDEPYLDRLLAALDHRYRRLLLYDLVENTVVDVEEAATRIAARERGVSANDVATDDDARERILISLYHGHVPRLSELEVVEYDPRTGTLRLRDPPDELETILEILRDIDESSPDE